MPIRHGPYSHGGGQLDPYDLDSVRVDTYRSTEVPLEPTDGTVLDGHGMTWIGHRVAAWNSAHPSNVGRYGHLDSLHDTVTLDESARSKHNQTETDYGDSSIAPVVGGLAALVVDTPTRKAIAVHSKLPPPPPPPLESQTRSSGSATMLRSPEPMLAPQPGDLPDAKPFQYHEPRYNPHRAMNLHNAAALQHQQVGPSDHHAHNAALYPPVNTAAPVNADRRFFSPGSQQLSSRYANQDDDDEDDVAHGLPLVRDSSEDEDPSSYRDVDETTEESPYKEPPLDASQANLPLPVKALDYTDEPSARPLHQPASFHSSRPDSHRGGTASASSSRDRYRYDPTLDVYYDIVTNTYVDSLP